MSLHKWYIQLTLRGVKTLKEQLKSTFPDGKLQLGLQEVYLRMGDALRLTGSLTEADQAYQNAMLHQVITGWFTHLSIHDRCS